MATWVRYHRKFWILQKIPVGHIEKNNIGLVISERFFQVIEVGYANTS